MSSHLPEQPKSALEIKKNIYPNRAATLKARLEALDEQALNDAIDAARVHEAGLVTPENVARLERERDEALAHAQAKVDSGSRGRKKRNRMEMPESLRVDLILDGNATVAQWLEYVESRGGTNRSVLVDLVKQELAREKGRLARARREAKKRAEADA